MNLNNGLTSLKTNYIQIPFDKRCFVLPRQSFFVLQALTINTKASKHTPAIFIFFIFIQFV